MALVAFLYFFLIVLFFPLHTLQQSLKGEEVEKKGENGFFFRPIVINKSNVTEARVFPTALPPLEILILLWWNFFPFCFLKIEII